MFDVFTRIPENVEYSVTNQGFFLDKLLQIKVNRGYIYPSPFGYFGFLHVQVDGQNIIVKRIDFT